MWRLLPLLILLVGCDRTPECEDPAPAEKARGSSPFQFDGPVPQNLLMISIDTLRKDHLGAYGDRGLTPFLDTFAREGVVMTDHLQCANWTQPGGACTMHGRLTSEIGHVPRLIEKNEPIPDGSPTLATVLESEGYYTALASGNEFMSPAWGTATGYREWRLAGNGLLIGEVGVGMLESAVARGDTDQGWFLHLHFMEPHDPYRPADLFKVGLEQLEPWPYDLTNRAGLKRIKREWWDLSDDEQALGMKWLTGLYEAEVRMVDSAVEAAVGRLRSAGLMDDTLVVVWTDHGEQFYEHGYLTHAHELGGEENDGAFYVWAPNLAPGRYDGPTWATDLTPTVLDLKGIGVPEQMTGVPVGFANPDRVRMAETVARNGVLQAASVDGYKLHYRWDDGAIHFYDRNVDPREAEDLFQAKNEDVQRLWCSICEHRSVLEKLVERTWDDPRGLQCP